MVQKENLVDWVHDALRVHGGRATILDVAKHIWQEHEADLRASGDLFYSWQYDFRWAATKLRKLGKMRAAKQSPTGIWELAGRASR